MSRKGKWRRNQQHQNEDFSPRSSNQPQHHHDSRDSLRLGSYHVTQAHAHLNSNLPPRKKSFSQPRPYERPSPPYDPTSFSLSPEQMKRRLLDYLKQCARDLEELPSEEAQEHEMDWKPEAELVIPQIDGGMQWAWGHIRPEDRAYSGTGTVTGTGTKRRATMEDCYGGCGNVAAPISEVGRS